MLKEKESAGRKVFMQDQGKVARGACACSVEREAKYGKIRRTGLPGNLSVGVTVVLDL